LTAVLLAYRQTILIAVYSHLLRECITYLRVTERFSLWTSLIDVFASPSVLDHSSQVWWRWSNVIFTLSVWAVEIVLAGKDGELVDKWKVE
jgi:hypothetical protein